MWWLLPTLLLGAILGGGGLWWASQSPATEVVAQPASYTGTKSCQQCHAEEYRQWQGSHHDLAMKPATPETVIGDFNNASLEHYGITSHMYRRDGKYFIKTEGPDGKLTEFEVEYTFGVDPLQQYLVKFPGGKLQAVNVAWDTKAEKWFLLDLEGQHIPPNDPLHWTGRAMNWNHMCADCHSTDVKKNYDLETHEFHTSFHEVNVSCEACHGPGSQHVAAAETAGRLWGSDPHAGLPKLKTGRGNLETRDRATQHRQIETCAKCHSRRHVISPNQQGGDPFLDHYVPELVHTQVYHVDGQLRPEEEGYVYGSFLQSKMYRKGVSCTDCHNPHTTKLWAEGNQLCAKCHTPAKYDTPSHHHHAIDTKGASCVECHMPETTYMQVDPRRDHSIRVPRPDLSVKLGTPNACNKCHTKEGEDAAWAAAAVEKWYPPKRNQPPHYGEALAAGREGLPEAEADLLKLLRRDAAAGDLDVGPIVRASALALLGERYYSRDAIKAATSALTDKEPLVRYAALGCLEGWHLDGGIGDDILLQVADLLEDSTRAVRGEAAKVLTRLSQRSLPRAHREAFTKALEEFRQGLLANQDQPGAHLGLGLVAAHLGEFEEAFRRYEIALQLDPAFYLARRQKAILHQQLGQTSQAEEVLRQGLSIHEDLADNYFSLGLLLAEQPRRQQEALAALQKAAELAPQDARYAYNLGALLQAAGQLDRAEVVLQKVLELQPGDPRSLQVLIGIAQQREDWSLVRTRAQQLGRSDPANPFAYTALALAQANVEQLTQARQTVAAGLQRVPDSPDLLRLGVSLAQQDGDLFTALRLAERGLATEPQNPFWQQAVGQLQAVLEAQQP